MTLTDSAKVLGLCFRPEKQDQSVSCEALTLKAGMGIEGDHHFRNGCQPKNQFTIIENEALIAADRDYSVQLTHKQSGRNLLCSGVSLNHLVGEQFYVGPVLLRGVELCEPCGSLERSTVKGAIKALIHRGGLRCEVLSDGVIRVGDSIRKFS